MTRLALTRITPSVTFHVDPQTGDVVAMSDGKEKARLLHADIRNQCRLQTWRRKAWVTDDFLHMVFAAREWTGSASEEALLSRSPRSPARLTLTEHDETGQDPQT